MRNEKLAGEPAVNGAADAEAIDQVRELLFGATKRTTEARLDDIDRQSPCCATTLRRASRRWRRGWPTRVAIRTPGTPGRSTISAKAIAELGATIRHSGRAGRPR